MEYGVIKWKIENVVYNFNRGTQTKESETDEGRTVIRKLKYPKDESIEAEGNE